MSLRDELLKAGLVSAGKAKKLDSDTRKQDYQRKKSQSLAEEAAQQAEIRRQAEIEALAEFRSRLQPGDRVILNVRSGPLLIGMAVEVKPPLVYVQWENASPAMQWVRIDSLTPPRR